MRSQDVTVIIPVFNRELALVEALASVRAQTAAPAEIIVVDDGSSDASAAVARSNGVRVIEIANGGPGNARNVGVAAADTPWVAFLDSDDAWMPHHLATHEQLQRERPGEWSLVGTSAVTSLGQWRGSTSASTEVIGPLDALWPTNRLVTSALLVPRERFGRAGGFSARAYGEDLDLEVALLEQGQGLASPVATVTYAQHEGQLSVNAALMRVNGLDVVREYSSRAWAPDWLADAMAVREAWDSYRAAADRGHLLGLLRELRAPRRVRALVEVMADRRRGRALSRPAG